MYFCILRLQNVSKYNVSLKDLSILVQLSIVWEFYFKTENNLLAISLIA